MSHSPGNMTESDFEFLIRTLSEARSRATELTVAVRARAGADHRLAALGHSAVSNIEKLLQEVRVLAVDQSQPARPRVVEKAEEKAEPARPSEEAFAGAHQSRVPSEHWVRSFIDDLNSRCEGPGEISFESVERLLELHKRTFLEDLETARRMYRVYPHLFKAANSLRAGAS